MKFQALSLKENPIHDKRVPWAIGLIVGGLALGGGLWMWERMKGVAITVHALANSVTVPKGQKLTVSPPVGATWQGQVDLSGSGVTGTISGGVGTAPLVLSNLSSGGTIAMSWVTAANAVEVATLQVSVS